MIRFGAFIFLACVICTPGFAWGQPLTVRNPLVAPIDQPSLIVVHASTEFDGAMQAKAGIDSLIRSFRKRGLPVIFLVSDLSKAGTSDWYTEERSPDYLVYSQGGEHNLPLRNPDVTVVGGFYGTFDMHRGCHSAAIRNVVNSYFHFQNQQGPLTIHLPVSAMYFYDEDQSLRTRILTRFSESRSWLEEAWTRILTPYLAADGELEFGSPFLIQKGRRTIDVPNPFSSVMITRDGRYTEGPSVSTSNYRFQFFGGDGKSKTVGRGPRKVLIRYER